MEKTIVLKMHEIARLRSEAGIRSQAELARKSGWSPNHMSQVFREARAGLTPSVTLGKLVGLCAALNANLTDIVEMGKDPETGDDSEPELIGLKSE